MINTNLSPRVYFLNGNGQVTEYLELLEEPLDSDATLVALVETQSIEAWMNSGSSSELRIFTAQKRGNSFAPIRDFGLRRWMDSQILTRMRDCLAVLTQQAAAVA